MFRSDYMHDIRNIYVYARKQVFKRKSCNFYTPIIQAFILKVFYSPKILLLLYFISLISYVLCKFSLKKKFGFTVI